MNLFFFKVSILLLIFQITSNKKQQLEIQNKINNQYSKSFSYAQNSTPQFSHSNLRKLHDISISNNSNSSLFNFIQKQSTKQPTEPIKTKNNYSLVYKQPLTVIYGVQIGKGNLYNFNLNSSRIIDLVTNKPSCVYQTVPAIPTGVFNLTYKYTARDSRPYNYSSFLVYVNNTLMQEINQFDYSIKSHATQIFNFNQGSSIQVKFCGKSWTSTAQGAILISVSLIKVAQVEYQTQNTILYNNSLKMTVQLQFIQVINKIPGSRRIFKQLLSFLINIDHLWLYIYHRRNYGNPMNVLLQSILNFQNQKWQFFSNEVVQTQFGINSTLLRQRIDFKKKYSSESFINIQNSGSTFLTNSTQFFVMNILLVVIIFMLGKLIHRLVVRYRIYVFFQQFSFNLSIILMLLDGNIQSFSYYFTSDCIKLFSLDILVKLSNILTLFLFFIFLFLVIGGYFLLLAFYPKQSKYFYENCKSNMRSCLYVFVSNGLFNLALGMTHIVFQFTSDIQLLLLICIEFSYCLFMVLIVSNQKDTFKFKYLVWINTWASFIRMALIPTHRWFDIYSKQSVIVIQDIQRVLIILYLFLWIISFFISMLILFKQIFLIERKDTQSYPKVVENSKNTKHLIIQSFQSTKFKKYNLKPKNITAKKQKFKHSLQQIKKSCSRCQFNFDQTINFNRFNENQLKKMISLNQNIKDNTKLKNQQKIFQFYKPKSNKRDKLFRISYCDDNNQLDKPDQNKDRQLKLKKVLLKRFKNRLNANKSPNIIKVQCPQTNHQNQIDQIDQIDQDFTQC